MVDSNTEFTRKLSRLSRLGLVSGLMDWNRNPVRVSYPDRVRNPDRWIGSVKPDYGCEIRNSDKFNFRFGSRIYRTAVCSAYALRPVVAPFARLGVLLLLRFSGGRRRARHFFFFFSSSPSARGMVCCRVFRDRARAEESFRTPSTRFTHTHARAGGSEGAEGTKGRRSRRRCARVKSATRAIGCRVARAADKGLLISPDHRAEIRGRAATGYRAITV